MTHPQAVIFVSSFIPLSSIFSFFLFSKEEMGGQEISSKPVSSHPGELRKEEKEGERWYSPYHPLESPIKDLPTKGEIKAAIPAECFEKSVFLSMSLVVRDCLMVAALVFLARTFLSTEVPAEPVSLEMAFWVIGWGLYTFWMGVVLFGVWVLAHECGHGAFSDYSLLNHVVGFVLHQSVLVPYFPWKFSHAKHHRRTNHMIDGESHIPLTAKENGLGENGEREAPFATWHEMMGTDLFAAFLLWTRMAFGFPLYLVGLASTGRLASDGTPLDGRLADHFRPESPMFTAKQRSRVLMSTVATFGTILLLAGLSLKYGLLTVSLWYIIPYLYVNAWLVGYTWLHHTDPSVPHYGGEEWTWVRGALSTIDRPYGIFDFFHHRIGSTHVAHHLFHKIPCYRAKKATEALKAYLGPKGLYNYNPNPWLIELWKLSKTCHYVDGNNGVQYYKSMDDLPKVKSL